MPQNSFFDQVLNRTDAGWTYQPGPHTSRIHTWILKRTFDTRTRAKTASIDITATHPDSTDWMVRLLLTNEGGEVRIREFQISPSASSDPRAAITARLQRGAGTQEVVEQTYWLLRNLSQDLPTAGAVMKEFRKLPRPGRRGRDLRSYAAVAQKYVGHLEKPAPVQALARELGISPTQARDLVYAARRKGLLTGGGKNRKCGGELTEEAWRLLNGTS